MSDNEETSVLPKIFNTGDAKAAEKVAELGTKALETLNNLGEYAAWVVGDAPKDFFDLVIGDRLKLKRARSLLKIIQRHQEIIRERGIEGKTVPISNNIAIPLFEAAQDESRPELQELWARLLANATDPDRCDAVRRNIIEAVKQFEPLDALNLKSAFNRKERSFITKDLAHRNQNEFDKFEVSFNHLVKLDCANPSGSLTSLGREIIRACNLDDKEE